MRPHLRSTVLALGLAASGLAHANLLSNGSFEQGAFAPPSNQTMTLLPGSTAITGWQVVTDRLAWINAGNPWSLTAQDGNFFLDLSDYSAGKPFGGIQQSFATTPGYEYTVTFELGSSNRWGRPDGLTVSAAGQSATYVGAATGTLNDWQPFSFVFKATGASTTLSFVGQSGVNYIGLDNVSATVTAVPEPSLGALWLAGLATMAAGARRIRSARSR